MRAAAAAGLLAVALALPAGAPAQPAGEANVSLAPAVAGKASRLSVTASGQATNTGQQAPSSISVLVVRGFKVDTRARGALCSDDQRKALNCPAGSKIGTGLAEGEASFLLQRIPFRATIEAFLMRPLQRGDIAGVAVVVREQNTGRQGAGRGRILPVRAGGPFGLELRFDELGTRQLPVGASATLNRFELSVAAHRTVRRKRTIRKRVRTRHGIRIRRKRVVRKRRHDLLRNPKACAGTWPYQVRVTFPSAPEQVRDGSVACSTR
jgi:hypothetical protein